MTDEKTWRILREREDITPEIEADIVQAVEWFDDSPTMGTTEFIDRLCKTYGGSGERPDDYDLDNYDGPAARRIMSIARRVRKENQS